MDNLVSVQCPKCGANLEIDEDRKSCFCSYCGAKIVIDDETKTFIYRNIDEAKIREVEADEKVRLKKLEMENRKLTFKHTLIKIWIGLVLLLAVAGLIILLIDQNNPNSSGYKLIMAAFLIIVWTVIIMHNSKENKKK